MHKHHHPVSQTLWLALGLNIFVALAKFSYGLITGTLSMVADGIHSFTDAGSSILGLISVRQASKPSDEGHHYGHEKFETLAALGIGALIGLTSWEILKKAISRFFDGSGGEYHVAGIWIIGLTMAINLGLALYERKKAKEFHSSVLHADSYHTLSDVWVSFSVLVSLVAMKYGVLWVDTITSLVIALYFAYVAFRLIREEVLVLSDAAFINVKEVERLVVEVEGVTGCHAVRTRGRPGNAFVDLHIQVDSNIDMARAHAITHEVETFIKLKIEGIREVLVHSEPMD